MSAHLAHPVMKSYEMCRNVLSINKETWNLSCFMEQLLKIGLFPFDPQRYAKGFDPDNWLSVNPDTAEITLNKQPDRESPFLVNGTYYAKILCLTKGRHYSITSRKS